MTKKQSITLEMIYNDLQSMYADLRNQITNLKVGFSKMKTRPILEERESGIKVYEEAKDMYDNAILDALKDKEADVVVEPAENNMKCPFCQQELSYMDTIDGGFEIFSCDCKQGIWFFGNDKLWQELIRTRKALEIAVDVLKEIDETRSVANHKIGTQDKTLNSGNVFCWTTPDEIHNTLEQITALTTGC